MKTIERIVWSDDSGAWLVTDAGDGRERYSHVGKVESKDQVQQWCQAHGVSFVQAVASWFES